MFQCEKSRTEKRIKSRILICLFGLSALIEFLFLIFPVPKSPFLIGDDSSS